ncbi:MAG: hypothetical protein HGA31_03880 [Candidatus Moranbacteria bacterium]|nr:hypothetical protein [Candidatus Moranbacteria bacterium]
MGYSFRLGIGRESSRLDLLQNGEISISREWSEARDMGKQLFEAIDGILKEVGLEPASVPSFHIETDIPDSFTSVKIAQSVAKAWEYGAESL